MKSKWIMILSALALFSAHQTRQLGVDTPDYSRNPAAIGRPTVVKKIQRKHRRKNAKAQASEHARHASSST
jgi:hypothetical protein